MPAISVAKRFRNPQNKVENDILDAVDNEKLFEHMGSIYVPRTRTLTQFGTWLIKFDEKGNVEDANIELFRKMPTHVLSKRLRMVGIQARVKNQRPMFCGRYIDHDWSREDETRSGH